MRAVLVRVGADASYGRWNGPVDHESGEFVYIPIPESRDEFVDGCRRDYSEVSATLRRFAARHPEAPAELPPHLPGTPMHLDPDFEHLTYGDVGNRRGSFIAGMTRGDAIVFYAGLRPVTPCEHRLLYAIIGLYIVDEVVTATSVSDARRHENAHTRKQVISPTDIVVRAQPGVSGRFRRCIPIGSFRDRAYRVRADLLHAWGGLSVTDGYIQRSAVPPRFNNPQQFVAWLNEQQPQIERGNWA